MRYARDCSLFTEKELSIINYCRLYLHITTVSELFDASGTRIIPELFSCQREPWFDTGTYVTIQRRPSDYQIRTKWQRLCREWTTSTGDIAASISLGKWTTPGHKLRRRRQSYIVYGTPNTVYHWHENCYWRYEPSNGPTTFRPIQPTRWTPSSPCEPVSTSSTPDGLLQVHSRIKPTRTKHGMPRPITTFDQHVFTLSVWEQHLINGATFVYAPYEIQTHLQSLPDNVEIYLVSDGSHKDGILTFGWVLGTSTGLILAEHSGMGYGTPTSHRAEAWAMLSGVSFLFQLHRYISQANTIPPHKHHLRCYSDNSGLIQRVRQRQKYSRMYPNATLAHDWDLIEQINSTLTDLPYQDIAQEWIRGHQDPQSENLPVAAKYNIRADELAGMVQVPPTHDCHPTWLLPSEKCRLVIQGLPRHGNYISAIRQVATLSSYYEYLRKRHRWTQHTQDTVDWKVLEAATSTTTIPSLQLMKLVHRKLPTRYEMAKSNRHLDSSCPFCGSPETFQHVLRCHNPKALRFREVTMEKIDEYLMSRNTPVKFRRLFCKCVNLSLCSDQTEIPSAINQHQASYQQQDKIGRDLLFCGFIAKAWRDLYQQAAYSDPTSATLNYTTFMAHLLQLLWTLQLNFWAEYVAAAPQHSGLSWHAVNRQQEYASKIRSLHFQKDHCMPAHQYHYFYENVEDFLSNATLPQLRAYLQSYEHAIIKSIQSARERPTQTLLQFPGFTIRRRQAPRSINADCRTFIPHHTPHPTSSRGTQYNRKHSRWKQLYRPLSRHQRILPEKTPPMT